MRRRIREVYFLVILIGLLAVTVFWAVLATIHDKVTGQSGLSSVALMFSGTILSGAAWTLLILRVFGIWTH